MNPFKLKQSRWLGWRFFISSFLVIALLTIVVPWQRLKVPILIQLAKHGPADTRRLAELFLVGVEGIEGDPNVIVPVLLSGLEDENDGVREMAAISLGRIRQYPEQVVPALLTALNKAKSPYDISGYYIVVALSKYGTNARPWSPIFLQMIQSNSFNCGFANPLFVLRTI